MELKRTKTRTVDALQFLIVAVAMANVAYFVTKSGLIRVLIVVLGTFAVNYLLWVIRAAIRPPKR